MKRLDLVETNQASANMENNRPINVGSKRDGINNDINMGVTDGFKIRRQSKWLKDFFQW